MRLSLRRGMDWKFFSSNKRDCPRNGMPLWQVLAPLLWGQSWQEREKIADRLYMSGQMYDLIFTTPSGMKYVSFGNEPPREQVIQLRRQIYKMLPRQIVDSLPSEIKVKYGPQQPRPCGHKN